MRLVRSLGGVVAAATVLLAVLAWRRDIDVFSSPWLVAGDLAVGLLFPLAGLLARGDTGHRLAFSAVGPAWLAGSVSGWLVQLHHGALLMALALFPTVRRWIAAPAFATGLVLAVAAPGALATGVVFAAFAGLFLVVDLREVMRERSFAVLAAAGVAGALMHAHWLAANSLAAEPWLYMGVLAGCAAAYVPASLLVVRRRRGFGSHALTGTVGLDALAGLLAAAVRDPGLRLTPDGEVVSDAAALLDPAVARSVAEAVHIVQQHERLRNQDRSQVEALEHARTRLVAAVDLERARASEQLERRVGAALDAALGDLDGRAPEVRSVLLTARNEMNRLLAGLPPADLGRIGLRRALERLAVGAPIPVDVDMDTGVDERVPPQVGAALYFVSCEAITNAAKHSGASRIRLSVDITSDGVVYAASDDGRGGADIHGSGLAGLVDRVDAIGGTVDIDSPIGHGTRITVRVSPEAVRRQVRNVRDACDAGPGHD